VARGGVPLRRADGAVRAGPVAGEHTFAFSVRPDHDNWAMEREWLQGLLDQGMSLERIGELAGRHPSTVAYWLARHGLIAAHHARHRNRGPLDRDMLAGLVAAGLSIRAIARETDRSYATVRHWLGQYGLETGPAARRRLLREARPSGEDDVPVACPRHGETPHRLVPGRGLRCLRCRSEAVADRRRKVKAALVAEAGGRCARCGYDRSLAALHFHHLDPAEKSFHLSREGVTRSLERARQEAQKCVLLCANCHAEVEARAVAADYPR
jgi:hypothetical protein